MPQPETPVIPAQAGIQVVHLTYLKAISPTNWIPACAGMTLETYGRAQHPISRVANPTSHLLGATPHSGVEPHPNRISFNNNALRSRQSLAQALRILVHRHPDTLTGA